MIAAIQASGADGAAVGSWTVVTRKARVAVETLPWEVAKALPVARRAVNTSISTWSPVTVAFV
jgi:hypothetical protein